jgi:putative NADH-flavin reductase
MVRVLVIGASQGIGLAVCQTAASRGHNVRAMSRRGTSALVRTDGIETFKGDALVHADVLRALDGMDVVVQALGVPPSLALIFQPVTLFSAATRVLLSAMTAAGVNKLVCVTGFGAGDSNASINILQRLPFKALLQNAYNDKSIQEDLVIASDLDWLIVRPGVLTNFAASGRYQVLTEPMSWRNGIVSRADVAAFIVKRISSDQFNREKPVIVQYPL